MLPQNQAPGVKADRPGDPRGAARLCRSMIVATIQRLPAGYDRNPGRDQHPKL